MNILITDKVDPLLIKLLKKHNITYEYNTEDQKDVVLKKINEFSRCFRHFYFS